MGAVCGSLCCFDGAAHHHCLEQAMCFIIWYTTCCVDIAVLDEKPWNTWYTFKKMIQRGTLLYISYSLFQCVGVWKLEVFHLISETEYKTQCAFRDSLVSQRIFNAMRHILFSYCAGIYCHVSFNLIYNTVDLQLRYAEYEWVKWGHYVWSWPDLVSCLSLIILS